LFSFCHTVCRLTKGKKTDEDDESEMDDTVEGEKKKEEVELQYIASIFDANL